MSALESANCVRAVARPERARLTASVRFHQLPWGSPRSSPSRRSGRGGSSSARLIINLVAATTTSTGLEVYARLDHNEYPKVDVTDADLAAVNITRNTFHGEWNYSINSSNN